MEDEPHVEENQGYGVAFDIETLHQEGGDSEGDELVGVLNVELKYDDRTHYLSHKVAKRWERVKEIMLGAKGKDLGGNKETIPRCGESSSNLNDPVGDWEERKTFVFGNKYPPLEIPEDSPQMIHQQNYIGEGDSWGYTNNFGSITLSKEDISRCREECRKEFENGLQWKKEIWLLWRSV